MSALFDCLCGHHESLKASSISENDKFVCFSFVF
jgi:hypothetical protein